MNEKHIDDLLAAGNAQVTRMGVKTTVVCWTHPSNDFEIVASSSAANAEEYSAEIGMEMCMNRIKSKLWELEAYVLHHERT